MSNSTDNINKLTLIFKPLLDEMKKDLKEHNVTVSHEILTAIGKIETRIDTLEGLVCEKKKTIARGGKKPTASQAVETTHVNEAQVQPMPEPQKNIPINKLAYFRENFKSNAEYRARYVTEELSKMMQNDASIMGKVHEAQKLTAQATFCWNYYKAKNKDVIDSIEKEYQAHKSQVLCANKPAQQVAEARTPPTTDDA